MAESFVPVAVLEKINNGSTDTTNTPTMVAAKLQVFNNQLIADDRMTNPGVLI